ncbi:cytochrome c [Hyphomicrobiales bacterium 4NK60-0047b]
MKAFLKLSIFILALCIASSAATAGSIEKGKNLAETLCAKCHSIEKKGPSTNKEAPPFRTFSKKWPLENLEEALAEGIVVGHDAMPEFKFNPDQITNFIAFLSSLTQKIEIKEE